MLRGTSLGIALAIAAIKSNDKLGIGHQIRWRVNNTSAGVVEEPDLVLNTEHRAPKRETQKPGKSQ